MDETIVRQKVAQKDFNEHADAMLAQAVVRRTVEMEVFLPSLFPCPMLLLVTQLQRKRRAEIKQKLEFLAKLEIVEKVKVC